MAKNKSSSRFIAGIALGTGLALYHVVMRPWQLNWGATQTEARRRYPGDELVPHPAYQTTRAISIRTPVAEIWPWLVQIGYQRGGFYSYDRLENMSGLDITSADRIVPEYQHLAVGDSIRIAPETPLTVWV